MKRVMCGLFYCLITTSLIAIDGQIQDATQEVSNLVEKPAHAKPSATAQAVMEGVAHVMGNVGTIIKDPHNPHNVGSSVANMIAGIINIAVAAIKDRNIDLGNENQNSDEEAIRKHLVEICEPLCQQITDMVVTKGLHAMEIM